MFARRVRRPAGENTVHDLEAKGRRRVELRVGTSIAPGHVCAVGVISGVLAIATSAVVKLPLLIVASRAWMNSSICSIRALSRSNSSPSCVRNSNKARISGFDTVYTNISRGHSEEVSNNICVIVLLELVEDWFSRFE